MFFETLLISLRALLLTLYHPCLLVHNDDGKALLSFLDPQFELVLGLSCDRGRGRLYSAGWFYYG